jgi:hypothetical protein
MILSAESALARDVINCESYSNQKRTCRVEGIRHKNIDLVATYSKASCERGVSWGKNRKGIWVKNGCRGRFIVESDYARNSSRNPDYDRGSMRRPYSDYSYRIRCESRNSEPTLCRVSGLSHKDVSLHRRLSDSSCVRGRTWGVNQSSIWVRNGCRAIFNIRDDFDRDYYLEREDRYWRDSHPYRYRLRGSENY